MKKTDIVGAEKYHRAHKRKNIWYRVLSVLSAITVFCTTYALILPAITMEDPVPGIKLDNSFVYEDETMLINLQITGRAVFVDQSLDSGDADPDEVMLSVEKLPQDDSVYGEYLHYMENSLEENALYSFTTLEFNFSYDGAELDVSNCTVNAEIKAKDALMHPQSEVLLLEDSVDESGISANNSDLNVESINKQFATQLSSESPETVIAFSAIQGTSSDISEQDTVYIPVNSDEIPVLSTSFTGNTIAFASYSAANPSFTVQYYTTLSVFDTYTKAQYDELTSAQKKLYLPLIDTSGGVLPTNSTTTSSTNKLIYVKLNKSGTTNANGLDEYTLAKHNQLMPLYTEKEFEYVKAPDIMYFDKLYTSGNYTLAKILVLKDGADPESINSADWTEYPADASFTNNAASAIAGKRIHINEGTVLRLVYEPKNENYTNPATFFDYDITDGYIYTNSNTTTANRRNTSTQKNTTTSYAKTEAYGINKFTAASGTAKLAFGNSNTGVAARSATYNGSYINQYNSGVYLGCSFGLVSGLSNSGVPIFSSGVSAPDLFSKSSGTGKTMFNNYTLQFIQQGDTYTLTAVNGAGSTADNLQLFSNPQSKYSHIFTNNFWPMDSASSWGADGHDLKFGNTSYKNYRNYSSNAGTSFFPEGDDGADHNSYFGMTYNLDFEISEDYEGPLEYIFYGDDDMWVFLDGKLVCDIGGVHSSVGEYVNLWDYIDKGTAGKHTLSFFYTERGASGSTCYMQFTLPSVSVTAEQHETTSIHVEKEVQNSDTTESFEFDINFTDASGNPLINTYTYTVYNPDLSIAANGLIENSATSFSLSNGQYIVVDYLPIGAKYTVTEKSVPGFFTVVSVNGAASAETNTVSGTLGDDRETVHFLNSTSAELPSTGGSGIFLYFVPLALAVIYAMFVPFIHKRIAISAKKR